VPRQAKPYIKDGWYRTSIGGNQHQKLCEVVKGLKAAELALARLRVQRADAQAAGATSQTPGPGLREA
jgi:hypothetical protein